MPTYENPSNTLVQDHDAIITRFGRPSIESHFEGVELSERVYIGVWDGSAGFDKKTKLHQFVLRAARPTKSKEAFSPVYIRAKILLAAKENVAFPRAHIQDRWAALKIDGLLSREGDVMFARRVQSLPLKSRPRALEAIAELSAERVYSCDALGTLRYDARSHDYDGGLLKTEDGPVQVKVSRAGPDEIADRAARVVSFLRDEAHQDALRQAVRADAAFGRLATGDERLRVSGLLAAPDRLYLSVEVRSVSGVRRIDSVSVDAWFHDDAVRFDVGDVMPA